METTKLKSQENLEQLRALTNELSYEGLRLMIDPQKTTSPEAVIEDVMLYLQAEKKGMLNPDSELTFVTRKNDKLELVS